MCALQFQTGVIRSVTLWRDAVALLSFNSKLVRLEVGRGVIGLKRVWMMFQFQTGAIRR